MTVVSDKTKAYEAAQHLVDALRALNAADGWLAVERPTTPYARTKNALLGVLETVASQTGASAIWGHRWAEAVYTATVLDGLTVEQALSADSVGTWEQMVARVEGANVPDEHTLNEVWGV